MFPKGWDSEKAQAKIQELKAAATQKARANAAITGRSVSGDEVIEVVRKEWAELCGVPFVPSWKLNGHKHAPEFNRPGVGLSVAPDPPSGPGADGLSGGVTQLNATGPLAPTHESTPKIVVQPDVKAPGPQEKKVPGPTGVRTPVAPPPAPAKPVIEKGGKGVVQPPPAAPPKVK